MDWKKDFQEGKELVIATCGEDCSPHAIVVISLGFVDDKLLIADCQMRTTIKNLKRDKHICIVGHYSRLKGKAELFSSGKYMDICAEKSKGYKVKNAILIEIEEVFDLDKGKKLK